LPKDKEPKTGLNKRAKRKSSEFKSNTPTVCECVCFCVPMCVWAWARGRGPQNIIYDIRAENIFRAHMIHG